jgi:hypothetical protein
MHHECWVRCWKILVIFLWLISVENFTLHFRSLDAKHRITFVFIYHLNSKSNIYLLYSICTTHMSQKLPNRYRDIHERTHEPFAQVKQSFQSDSDPDYVGFRRNPTKPGRNSIGWYAVPIVSDGRNPTETIPTTHIRDPTEIICIRWDPTGHNWPGWLTGFRAIFNYFFGWNNLKLLDRTFRIDLKIEWTDFSK